MANAALKKVAEVATLKLYVALDERNELTIARLEPYQTTILQRMSLFRNTFDFKLNGPLLYLAFESGDLEVLRLVYLGKK